MTATNTQAGWGEQRLIDDFLIEREPITWSAPKGFPGSLVPAGLFAQDAARPDPAGHRPMPTDPQPTLVTSLRGLDEADARDCLPLADATRPRLRLGLLDGDASCVGRQRAEVLEIAAEHHPVGLSHGDDYRVHR